MIFGEQTRVMKCTTIFQCPNILKQENKLHLKKIKLISLESNQTTWLKQSEVYKKKMNMEKHEAKDKTSLGKKKKTSKAPSK